MIGLLSGINAGLDTVNKVLNIGEYFDNKKYQRQLQQTIFDREDSLIQRRVADAQLAGISPLAALGMGGTAQVVSMPDFNPAMSGTGLMQAEIAAGTAEAQMQHDMERLDKQHEQEMERIAKEYENAVSQQQIENAFQAMMQQAEIQSKEKLDRIKNTREREQAEKEYKLRMAEMRNNQTKWEEEFKHKKKEDKRRFILDCGKAILDTAVDIGKILTFQGNK